MIDLNAARRRDGRDGPATAVADDDVLPRLALWLADVAAEAALGVRALEADSPVPDATPDQVPAPVVPR